MFTTAELFGPFHSGRPHLQTARNRLTGLPINELQTLLGPGLPSHRLAAADEGPFSRERVYSLLVTVWTFLWQVLNPGSACREAVQKVGAWFKLQGLAPVSPDTSPYCQARRKIPLDTLQQLLKASAHQAEQGALQAWHFHGRAVKVGDGTFCQAPDTPAL